MGNVYYVYAYIFHHCSLRAYIFPVVAVSFQLSTISVNESERALPLTLMISHDIAQELVVMVTVRSKFYSSVMWCSRQLANSCQFECVSSHSVKC